MATATASRLIVLITTICIDSCVKKSTATLVQRPFNCYRRHDDACRAIPRARCTAPIPVAASIWAFALFHYATTSTRLDMRQRSVHICLPGLTSSAHRWLIRTVNTGYVPALWAYCYASNLGLSYNYTVRQKNARFLFLK